MIIGLCGEAGAGKDTAGAYLIKRYGFERRSFAEPVKNSLAAFLNITRWELDALKDDPDARICTQTNAYTKSMNFREALQRYAHHGHREVFGDNFWLDIALPVGGYYVGRKIVITDVRYQNEVDRINHLGGVIIRIVGRGSDNKSPHRRYDTNELNLGMYGYVVVNNDSLENLYSQIDKALDALVGLEV